MLAVEIEGQLSEERQHRLKSQLCELERVAWLAGNPTLLHCSDCDAAVSSQHAIEGAMEDWPYCPFHPNKPLMIHAMRR